MAKYSREELENAVQNSESYAGVLRTLGIKQAGGSQSYWKKRISEYGIDTSHFTGQGHNKGKPSSNKLSAEAILIRLPEGSHRTKHRLLKRAMVESGIKYLCGIDSCPSPEPFWNGQKLTLQVDHIDCDCLNNEIDNLRFICPNCHSQLSCR